LLHTEGNPGSVQTGSLDQAIEAGKGHPVILLAPAEDTLLTTSDLQIRQAAKLRKAIPYALEEQLSEDVEDLHFALGPRTEDGQAVAIIKRELLDDWLQAFADHQLIPRAILPDVLALPWREDEWFVGVDDQRALIRTGPFTGFACDRENLMILLRAALEEREEKPTNIHLWQCGAPVLADWSMEPPRLLRHRCDGSLLQLLAEGAEPRNTINLLQGDYSTQTDLTKTLKPWRWAALLLGVLFAVGVTGKIIEKKQLTTQKTALLQQSEQIYRQTFPGVKKVVNPRVQMEQHLKRLRGGDDTAQSSFLDLLASSSKIISADKTAKLESIRFRNNQLDLKVSAKTLSELDALKTRLKTQAGLNAELLNADSGQGKASGNLRIKP
jgi:general secretion pathway protein L